MGRIEKTIIRDGKEFEVVLVEGWDKPVVKRIFKLLLDLAINSKGETIYYSELCDRLKPEYKLEPHFVDRLFAEISYSCMESKLPPLSALVVSQENRMPGNGFFEAYYSQIKDKDKQWERYFEDLKTIKEFDYWDIFLEAMSD